MNMRARSVACLLPFFLTGCFHFHKQQSQQFQYLAPPPTVPKPDAVSDTLGGLIIPEQPLKTEYTPEVAQTPKPPAKHHKNPKPIQQAIVTPPPAPAEAPGVSAIGQLSTGDPVDLRRETDESLSATERGLNGLGRTLNDQEQKTAAQIREYLKQAREALISNDVEGASTLAAKAKVLLTELMK